MRRREAIAVLSSGALVPDRELGNPCLLDIHGCRHGDDVPLLSAHRVDELLGHITDVWVENFVVKGALRFTTQAGRRAFERLPSGISVRTTFDYDDVVIVDATGRLRDFDAREWRMYHQDPAAILHVKRWRLLEVSLTDHPADHGAIARPISPEARRIRKRMLARQQSMFDQEDNRNGLISVRMPDPRLILHGAPEPLL